MYLKGYDMKVIYSLYEMSLFWFYFNFVDFLKWSFRINLIKIGFLIYLLGVVLKF